MTAADLDPRDYADEEYDAFAVMDAVPLVVRGVEHRGSRFVALLSAFLGIDSVFIGEQELNAP